MVQTVFHHFNIQHKVATRAVLEALRYVPDRSSEIRTIDNYDILDINVVCMDVI